MCNGLQQMGDKSVKFSVLANIFQSLVGREQKKNWNYMREIQFVCKFFTSGGFVFVNLPKYYFKSKLQP